MRTHSISHPASGSPSPDRLLEFRRCEDRFAACCFAIVLPVMAREKSIGTLREYLDGVSEQWDRALARLKAFVEE